MEAVKTFMFDENDIKEANEARNAGNSGGGQ